MSQPNNNSVFLKSVHSKSNGLTSEEANQRLMQFGANEIGQKKSTPLLIHFLTSFASPLALILLFAAVVMGIIGDSVNAIIIIIIVTLSAIIDFSQTVRSQKAVERLHNQVTPTAVAVRDGRECEIQRRDVVPGDVVRLVAGDLVPADARLIESHDLHVDQSVLTGESLPVEKEADDPAPARHMVYLGSSVVSGMAKALVMMTGKGTQFGEIAERLARRPPPTEFEHGIRRFGFFIIQTVFFLVLFVVTSGVIYRKDPFESLLFAVALAVGLTPEFLPMMTTVTLTKGAVRLSRQKVIVKHLAAIQNFGSMDILCTDKTGTLTSGALVLDQHLDPLGNNSHRVLFFAYLNSIHQTGVSNPVNLAVLERTKLNPLDAAILAADHPDVHTYQKIDEIPFDFERRRTSIVVGDIGKRMIITKGAPESVLPVCIDYQVNDVISPMDSAARSRCEETYRSLSEQGYRVLAVACRNAPVQDAYRSVDEKELTLVGYLAFIDPPIPDAGESIAALQADGVSVKILTGDNEAVARHVCDEIGLDSKKVVLGDAIETISDSALEQVAEQTMIFARVSPIQKHRILLALKRRGHVVGYLGDGINDAPSLHSADVGISVSTGVDVAKDAAEIILTERSLKVLHAGIVEGRKAYGNLMKYLLMGTSSNFGNMFSMAAAYLFLPFLPMLPVQILLNNFLYDLSQVTIPTDHVDETFLHKPRKWNIAIIRQIMFYIGPLSSIFDFLTFFVLISVFRASAPLFHTGWFIESLATQTLVLLVIRTQGSVFKSRPSRSLVLTVLGVVAVGVLLPVTPLANWFGFVPLPGGFFAFLVAAVVVYLSLVEFVKRRLMKRLIAM